MQYISHVVGLFYKELAEKVEIERKTNCCTKLPHKFWSLLHPLLVPSKKLSGNEISPQDMVHGQGQDVGDPQSHPIPLMAPYGATSI